MDRDPQTAAELYELVYQWPEGARPEGMYYSPAGNRYADFWYLGRQQNYPGARCELPTAHAGLMFIASGLRWLIDHGYAVWQDQIDGMFRVGPWNETRSWEGKTLFLALHACVVDNSKNPA